MAIQLRRKNHVRHPKFRHPPAITRIQWFDAKALSTREIAYKLHRGKTILRDRESSADRGTRVVVNDIANLLEDTKYVVTEKNLGDSLNKIRSEVNQIIKKTRRRNKELGALTQGDEESLADYQKDIRETVGQIRRLAEKMVMSGGFRNFLWRSFLLIRDTLGPVLQRSGERKDFREPEVEGAEEEGELYDRRDRDSGVEWERRKSYDEYEPRRASPRRYSVRNASTSSTRVGRQSKKVYEEYEPRPTSPRRTSERTTSTGSRRVDPKIIRRWKDFIREIQQDPSLQESVTDMKNMFTRLRDKYGPVAQRRRQGLVQRQRELTDEIDHDVMEIEYEAKKLFERCTGRKMQPLINEMNALFVAIREDRELSDWIQEVNRLFGTVFTEADLDEEQFSSDLNQVIERGQQIWGGKHKPLAQALLREIRGMFDGLRQDKSLNYVRESLGTVIADLFLDTSGRFVLKPDLYVQLTDALRPAMAEMLKDIRIPHIYHNDEQIEFTINDILVDLSDFQPTQFKVSNIVDLAVGENATGIHIEFRVSSNGSRGAIRGMKFWYQKKTFPKLEDRGIVDASLTGKGLSFDMDVEVNATREDILNYMTGQGERGSREYQGSDEYGYGRERGRGSFEEEDAERIREERRRDSALFLKEEKGDSGQEYKYAGEIFDNEGHGKPIYMKREEFDGDRSLYPSRRDRDRRALYTGRTRDRMDDKDATLAPSIRQRSTSTEAARQIFRVKRVVVRCKTLRLNFRKAHHKLLYKMAQPFIIPRVEREIQKAITENLYRFVGELNRSMTTARGYAVRTVERTAGGRIIRGTDTVGRPVRNRSSSIRADKLREGRRTSSEYKEGRESDSYRERDVTGYKEKETDRMEGREVLSTDEEKEMMTGYPRRNRKYEEDEGVDFTEVYERVSVVKVPITAY